MNKFLLNRVWLSLICLSIAGCAALGDKYPDVSSDGLQRVEKSGFDAFYLRSGESLNNFNKVMIADTEVSFRKNWLRDQNTQRSGPTRVDKQDMARLRTMVAEEFTKAFTKEMTEKGQYQLVEQKGADVLVLKPVIRDLDIRAPDVKAPLRETSFVTSAAEMTLELELYAGDRLVGRIIDKGRDFDDNVVERTNSVVNRFETGRIMRRWAANLRRALVVG